jgi:hypothetical protein
MATQSNESARAIAVAPSEPPPTRATPLRRSAIGRPFPAEHLAAVQHLIERFGVSGAARELRVTRDVIDRVNRGQGLREGSIEVIVARLRRRGDVTP